MKFLHEEELIYLQTLYFKIERHNQQAQSQSVVG